MLRNYTLEISRDKTTECKQIYTEPTENDLQRLQNISIDTKLGLVIVSFWLPHIA